MEQMQRPLLISKVDEYGFDTTRVWASEGGSFHITDFGHDSVRDDYGFIVVVSPKGIGFNERLTKHVLKNIEDYIHSFRWLSDDEKAFLVEAALKIKEARGL